MSKIFWPLIGSDSQELKLMFQLVLNMYNTVCLKRLDKSQVYNKKIKQIQKWSTCLLRM